MTNTLTLFPDTNLLIQCKPLDEIDWSVFGDFDVVDLIISRPVQAEIDKQKSKGLGRLAKRARSAAALFGKILDTGDGFLTLAEGQPLVRLHLRVEYRADLDLADRLNYDERDDQLVGIAAGFAKNNLTADVRVITLDIGPRASAKSVGIACELVRDDWLLEPEADEVNKQIKSLQTELQTFKNAEPAFELSLDNLEIDQKKFKASMLCYPALDENQVKTLMNRIKERFPEATDFGAKDSKSAKIDGVNKLGNFAALSALNLYVKEFVPASDDAISKYKVND